MSQTISMKIQYIDGTDQTFEWDIEPNEAPTSRFEKGLQEEYILLETGDKLIIIPKQNIKTIAINAIPPKLPPTAIHGARLVE